MAKIVFAIVLISLAAWRGSARAADAPVEVEDLLRRGIQLRREGADQKAFELFRQAYGMRPTPRTAAQLGLVEMALNYWVEAEEHLEASLASGDNGWIEANRGTLADALVQVRIHIAKIRVVGYPDGSEVTVNGRAAGLLPQEADLSVAEGPVEVSIRSPSASTWTQRLVLQGGSTTTVSPVVAATLPVKALESDDSVRTEPPPPAKPRRILAWAAAGGAAAIAAGAVIAGLKADDKVSQFDGLRSSNGVTYVCGAKDPLHGTDPECSTLYSDWQRDHLFMLVGAGSAAVLAAVSGLLFWTRPEAPPTEIGLTYDARQRSAEIEWSTAF